MASCPKSANSGHSNKPTKLPSSIITNQMIPKKLHDARVEIAVKGRSIEASGHVGADAGHCRRELRRARWQEDKVIGRNGADVWLARQAVGG
jgi:hypothetical protein